MRKIDAEHFDSRMRAAGGMCEEELTEDFKDGVLTVLDMLKTEPTVDDWIPCNERNPENADCYLVTRYEGRVDEPYHTVDVCFFTGHEWIGAFARYVAIPDVVAWKPLPEPYKGD